MPNWLFQLAAALLLAIAARLLYIALFRDRPKRRRRCPRCWYELTPPTLFCPECGHTARSERKARKTHRRWKLAAVATLLIPAAWPVANARALHQNGWLKTIPSTVLVLLPLEPYQFEGSCIPVAPESFAQGIWREIKHRDYGLKLAGWHKEIACRRIARSCRRAASHGSTTSLSTRIYRVGDLVHIPKCSPACHSHRDLTRKLLEVAESATAFYRGAGPYGSIHWLSGRLVVTAPADGHERLAAFFDSFRAARESPEAWARVTKTGAGSSPRLITRVYHVADLLKPWKCEPLEEYKKSWQHTFRCDGPGRCDEDLRDGCRDIGYTLEWCTVLDDLQDTSLVHWTASIWSHQNFCIVCASPEAHQRMVRVLADMRLLTRRANSPPPATGRANLSPDTDLPSSGRPILTFDPATLAPPTTPEQARHEGALTKLRRHYHGTSRTPLNPDILAEDAEPHADTPPDPV